MKMATPESHDVNRHLDELVPELRMLLDEAAKQLRVVMQDEIVMEGTPLEVQYAMEISTEAIGKALRQLVSISPKETQSSALPGGPTHQQGQFLAFIREYLMRNYAGLAPTHAEFQRFFNLTPPSVNSMLIRLEQRGFIRRIPRKARAIELIIDPAWIPPLDHPFMF